MWQHIVAEGPLHSGLQNRSPLCVQHEGSVQVITEISPDVRQLDRTAYGIPSRALGLARV